MLKPPPDPSGRHQDSAIAPYRHTERILHSQRLFLGAVAGILVGWGINDAAGQELLRMLGVDLTSPSNTGTDPASMIANGGGGGGAGAGEPASSKADTKPQPNPGSNSDAGKIGPFALAFIAGYGVDLLFSALDGFMRRFQPNGK